MAGQAQGHPRRWQILGVLLLALFGVALDNTVLTVALPTLAVDLHASVSQLQWMVDAYILVFAGFLLVSGALSDRYGRRLMLVLGLAVFGIGSAVTPLVRDADQLIALRAFMGLGAAFATPSTLSIIGSVFTEAERTKAIAVWSAVFSLGMVIGPVAGGFLLEHWPWQSVFVVNVPLAVAGIVAALAIIPESKAEGKTRLDPIGAGLSIVTLVSLIYAIIEAPNRGWTDALTLGLLGLAAVVGIAFVAWERRIEAPMLDINLFRNRRFSAASISVTLCFFAINGSMFFLTMYLQQIMGLTALETGFRFIAIAVGVAIASPFSAILTKGVGARITTALGLTIVAAGMGLFATIGVNSGDLQIVAVLMVVAIGLGLAMTPATDAVMGALPAEQFGVGSAVNDTTREIGGALGIAILGSMFSSGYAARMADVAATLPAGASSAVSSSFAGAAAVAAQVGGAQGEALISTAKDAFVGAMGVTSLIGVGFALLGAFVAAVFLPGRANAEASDPAETVETAEGATVAAAAPAAVARHSGKSAPAGVALGFREPVNPHGGEPISIGQRGMGPAAA